MKKGYLSQYFQGLASKQLSAVEANPSRSNQHEFNGDKGLRNLLGEPDGVVKYPAKIMYLTDDDEPIVSENESMTWYDARQPARIKNGVMRWEYRLYFPSSPVSQCTAEGDLLVIAKCTDGSLLAIIAEKSTSIARQIEWLFGLSDDVHPGFSVKSELETDQNRIGYAASVILEQIGIVLEEDEPSLLDQMLSKFGGTFPKTIDFSEFARSTVGDLFSIDDPDTALVAWMDREEILFRTLEKHLLGDQLRELTKKDIETEPFIKLVQSALQRRKSRAGSALENHMEQVFKDHGITYSRGPATEGKTKPDFIFPGIKNYHNSAFPQMRLTMLAAKTTLKDRWRQILTEAERIPNKHLLTLQPGISENQTDELKAENVQLVLPKGLHLSFSVTQQSCLMDVSGFIQLVDKRQKN